MAFQEKYLQAHVELMQLTLHAAGISTVTVDCPTDQWGIRGPNPSACDDNYRSSVQHPEAKVPFVYLHHKNDLCRFTALQPSMRSQDNS